ncbi:MAG: YIP1 family protein, partial [Candidatus Krumholzibacteria bacterium]|nr:YIP1 family protein [Candidatus Krumholzibacteria bacterium]
KILRAILNSLDVFQLWFYILVGMGVMHVFKLSGRSAALVVIPVWLVFVLIALVSARLGA